MLPAGTTALIACSGGADSVAALVRLARTAPGVRWHVASVDHGLRGDAGRRDVEQVGALAARLGFPFHALRVAVDPVEAAGSLEARARDARYQALRACAESIDATHVVVAHTLDDLAETVWLRLVRGAGPRGLAAMRSERPLAPDSRIVLWRPFLSERRAELRAELDLAGVTASEDATNADRRFARNRARLDALPAFARTWGRDPAPLLARLARAAAGLDAAGERLCAARGLNGSASLLRAQPRGLRRAALARAYAAAGGDPGRLTRRHLARALRVVDGRVVAASLPGRLELRRSGGTLRFAPTSRPAPASASLPLPR